MNSAAKWKEETIERGAKLIGGQLRTESINLQIPEQGRGVLLPSTQVYISLYILGMYKSTGRLIYYWDY